MTQQTGGKIRKPIGPVGLLRTELVRQTKNLGCSSPRGTVAPAAANKASRFSCDQAEATVVIVVVTVTIIAVWNIFLLNTQQHYFVCLEEVITLNTKTYKIHGKHAQIPIEHKTLRSELWEQTAVSCLLGFCIRVRTWARTRTRTTITTWSRSRVGLGHIPSTGFPPYCVLYVWNEAKPKPTELVSETERHSESNRKQGLLRVFRCQSKLDLFHFITITIAQ